MLEAERKDTLAEVIDDLCGRDEMRSLSLTTMLRLEVEYLEAAVKAVRPGSPSPIVR